MAKKIKNNVVDKEFNKKARRQARKFVLFSMSFFALLLLLSLLLVAKVQLTHSKNGYNLQNLAKQQYESAKEIDSKRGDITDRNGTLLATDLEVYDLKFVTARDFKCKKDSKYVDCAFSGDVKMVSNDIAKAIGTDKVKDKEYIETQITNGIKDKKYEVMFGKVGNDLTLTQKQALEKLNLPWLEFESKNKRYYPFGDFASYLIGYVYNDEDTQKETGGLGVEKFLDGYLSGQDSESISATDLYGVKLNSLQSDTIAKIDGTNVELTLDSTIQTYIQEAMDDVLNDYKNFKSSGLFTIVMNAKTGEIYGAQSYPTFDPNKNNIVNYNDFFTSYCFEPGSTFKTFTMAAAYENGTWDESKTYSTGKRQADDWDTPIGDWNNQNGWGKLNFAQGYYLSSNTIFTHVMDTLSHDQWRDFVLNKMLFGTPVKTEFISTPSCSFDPQYPIDYATTSFGQGMTVNTLQLLRAFSALVNNGTMSTPHYVKKVTNSTTGEEIYNDEKDLKQQTGVVSEDLSKFVKDKMHEVTTYKKGSLRGTGYRYGDKYEVGMKTGTAQIVGSGGSYLKSDYLYSAIVSAPADDPEILVYTATIKPNGSDMSNQGFPDYVNKIVDKTLDYLHESNKGIDITPTYKNNTISNYVGQDINKAKQAIKKLGFSTLQIGSGNVTSQYPRSGQSLVKGDTVVLVGDKGQKAPNFEGLSVSTASSVCNLMDYSCTFKGTGKKITKEKVIKENKKYELEIG